MDPLTHLKTLLTDVVPADILENCIAQVRREYGGEPAYIYSPRRERIHAIHGALAQGVSTKSIAAIHGITPRAVRYHRLKTLL